MTRLSIPSEEGPEEPTTGARVDGDDRSSGPRAVDTSLENPVDANERIPAAAPSSKDVALALLTGGEEGIRLWNDRRARDLHSPDLTQFDLSGLRLDGVDLSRCTLRNANFKDAKLPGACLDDSDLRGANFERARLEFANLRQARLANARLNQANLRWCRFGGSDLRNADLSDAVVDPCDFSMTDLAGAKLPSELLSAVKDAVAHIESAGHHPRAVFFSLTTLCAFAAITAAGASDVALISDQGSIKIPVLGNEVSVRAFFFIAPFLCVAFLSYVAIYLRYLAGMLLKLPLRLPDGAEIAEALSPWMLNIAPDLPPHLPTSADQTDDNRSRDIGGSRRLIVFVTRAIVPVTLTIMLCLFLGSRRERDLWLMYTLVLASIAIAPALWRRPKIKSSSVVRFVPSAPLRAFWLSMAAGALGGALAIAAVTRGHFLRLQGRGAKLEGARLEHLSLVGADFSKALLNGATFHDVDCRGAVFYDAKMKGVGGKCGQFTIARFEHADLESAWLTCAHLQGALLNEAVLPQATLQYADLSGAKLIGAILTKADLRGADLRGAVLTGAKLENARLEGAWCDEDTQWPDGFDASAAGLNCSGADDSHRERESCDPRHQNTLCATGPRN
jgi:uncharacterized protein YjbI with pentapeptide repeats